VPVTAFTDPQVARVGLTEKEAKEKKVDYESATMPFGHVARAIETDETAGIMKVLIDPKTEKVLGAALVGAEAGELIHVFVMAVVGGLTGRQMVDAEYVHPTFAEGIQSLLLKLKRYTLGS
jgi:pyruvate/2-oxoglutarate dehydrogenase complex dihydrolipoamide dehydrogenase (E3) component